MRVGSAQGAIAVALLLVFAVGCSGSEVSGAMSTDADTVAPEDAADAGDDAADAAVDAEDVGPGDVDDAVDADDAADAVVVPPPDWRLESLGDAGVIADLFAVSADELYAVGGGRVLRNAGGGWAVFGEPTGATLHGVWAGDGVVVVVGEGGLVATRAAGARTWEVADTGVDVTLRGVYGRDADDIWVFGDDATVLRFDGDAWTSEFTLAGIALHSAWIAPGTTGREGVYAVGSGGRLAVYEAGAWRTVQIAQGSAVLRDIFGVDDTLFAVGTGATIAIKRPTAPNWQGQTSNDPRDRDLFAVVGAAGDDVVAFGAGGVIIRYDGTRWSTEEATGPFYAAADLVSAAWVDGPAGGRYYAAAAAGGGLARVGAGGWLDMATRPELGVRDMAGDADNLWTVGRGGLALTRGPQGWSAVDVGTGADLNGVDVGPDGVVWVVGAGGAVARVDGAEVTHPDALLPLELFGVAATADRVYVSGKGGTLVSFAPDGGDPTLIPTGVAGDLRAVVVGGDGALWLAGAFGTLLRLDDGDALPVAIPSGVGGNLNDLAATANGVLAVGDNGVVLEATADGVSLLNERPGLFLFGVAVSGDVQFAVGWSGAVLRRVGDAFVDEVSGVSGVLQAVWTDGAEAVVGGRDGVLLERLEAP